MPAPLPPDEGLMVTLVPQAGYLHFLVAGPYPGRQTGNAFIDRLLSEAKSTQTDKVLVDLRGMTGAVSSMDRYELAEKAAETWSPRLRVAILYRPADTNRFFEDVAFNRGVDTRVFFEEASALDWLLGE